MQFLAFRVKHIVAVCNEAAELIKKKISRTSNVIPNPITFDYNAQINHSRTNDFIFVGRIVHQKNPEIMIRSFSIFLAESKFNSTLHIVGDGILMGDLKFLCKDLSLTDHVIFHGWKNHTEIRKLMERSKTLISTSYLGGMELVRAEALASGCAVVTTETGGTHYFHTEEDIGFLITKSDVLDISRKMLLSVDDKYWTSQAIAKRRSLVKKFDLEIVANQILMTLK
jgi:glycosyltransferase involved in cell wall biosynthesis